MDLTSRQSMALSTLSQMLGIVSIFISCILAFLIIYANGFLIKRRKKEFGVYMTLGMRKGRISRILMYETVLVGILSLIMGLMLGVFLSQGMAMVTAKLINADIKSFSFVFSAQAAKNAVIYFGLTFILVLIFNIITIRRQRLIDLIYADRKNERFKAPHLKLSIVVFLIALALILLAYFIVTHSGVFPTGPVLSAAVCMGVAGTFLFFFSLSGFFLKLLQQNKNVYLSKLNMFVLRQINSKINTTYISIGFVCLMLFVAICTLSSGIGLAEAIKNEMISNAPYSATFSMYAVRDINEEAGGASGNAGGAAQAVSGEAAPSYYQGLNIVNALASNGVDLTDFSDEYLEVRYYDAGTRFRFNTGDIPFDLNTQYVKLSDYNKLREMQALPPIELAADEFTVNCRMGNEWPEHTLEYITENPTLSLNGILLRSNVSMFASIPLITSENWDFAATIVVNDALLDGVPVSKDVLNLNYTLDNDTYNSMCESALKEFDFSAFLPNFNDIKFTGNMETRFDIIGRSNEATTMIAYLAVYLGMIFLIASATVLAITQLSETSDNVRRYGLLRKLGVDDKMINSALFSQILIYFGAPLALALVHSFVGIIVAGNIVGVVGDMSILGSSLFTAGVLALIYGGYFLSTYWGSKNILYKEYMNQQG
jgi:putative ABC transport system permease protein